MDQKKLTSGIILLLLSGALVSCNIFGTHERDSDQPQIPKVKDHPQAEIVLGKRIKQVHLGDSIQKVRRLYGRPKFEPKNWISGYYRSWYGYEYFEGTLGGVKLYLRSNYVDGDYGERVNRSIVDLISIQAKPSIISPDSSYKIFRGTTHDEIGLGSNRAELIDGLGNPDSVNKINMKYGPPVYSWFYCVEHNGARNEVQFGIQQDSVFSIAFGYYRDEEVKDCEWLRE